MRERVPVVPHPSIPSSFRDLPVPTAQSWAKSAAVSAMLDPIRVLS